MLAPAFLSLMRKIVALLIVSIATGLAPATVIIGFCAKMPCCFGEARTGPALAVDMAGCCSTIKCYEAPANELRVAGALKVFPPTTLAVLPTIPPMRQGSPASLTIVDTSPPPTTSERLSSLSVFLI